MRMRKKPWAIPELEACEYYIKKPEEKCGKWSQVFKNKVPLRIELGCGKGVFTSQTAFLNRDINFIGIDINSDVLAVARRNITKLYSENNADIDNIVLFNCNVDFIDRIFSPEDEVEAIYINFCNPWPKKKHKKRRLTYPTFLNKYKSFLKKDGYIFFKTDDDELFNESLEYFNEAGLKVEYITYDLHNSDIKNNILTEHEIMFSNMGIKIKYCILKNI